MPGTPGTRWIATLYDAAINPAMWPAALAAVADEVRADVGLLFGVSLRTVTPTMVYCTHAGAPLNAFASRHVDNAWFRAAATYPVPSVARTEELVPIEDLVQSSFYAEVLEPAGLFHSLGANLAMTSEEAVCVSFLRSRSLRAFDADQMAWVGEAIPHLQRAVQLTKRLAGVDLLCSAALDALSLLASPVFLLDGAGRVVFRNLAAESLVDGPAGLEVREGRLCAFSRESSRRIDRLVREAMAGVGNGGYVSVPRRDGGGPVVLHLTRLGDSAVRGHSQTPAFVVLAGTEGGAVDLPCELLREAFGLTEREASVASLLAGGRSLPAIANALGVSINTARTHAARVYDKTGTGGQAELVRDLPCRVPQVHRRRHRS